MFREFFCAKGCGGVVAWGGLVLVILHAVFNAVQKLRINIWYSSFYSLLQTSGADLGSGADEDGVERVRHSLIQFFVIVLPSLFVHPAARWIRSNWALSWRMKLTRSYFARWDPNLRPVEGASQRLQEDCSRFARGVDSFLVLGMDSIATLIVFIPILVNLGEQISPPRFISVVRGAWLVVAAFMAACVGLIGAIIVGRKLLWLEVANQRVEAYFRRRLVLLEAAPAAVCAAAEKGNLERPIMDGVWEALTTNYRALFCNFLSLNFFLGAFDQGMVVFPYLVVAPLLFAGYQNRVPLGVLVQLSDSFGKVFGSLSIIAESWAGINEFASTIVRLRQFEINLKAENVTVGTQLMTKTLSRSDETCPPPRDRDDSSDETLMDPPLPPVPAQYEPRVDRNGAIHVIGGV